MAYLQKDILHVPDAFRGRGLKRIRQRQLDAHSGQAMLTMTG